MGHTLILGATGGIGAALSRAAQARGDTVVGLSRNDGLDLCDAGAVDTALTSVEGPFDRILVATGILAAEGGVPEKSLTAIEAGTMAELFAVNAIGPALILKHVPRLMAPDAKVGVLTARVGSITDNQMGGWYSYRAAKAAANQITRTAAIEIGRKHKEACIVALHPGTVDTPFTGSYPAHKKVSADQAAENLLGVLDRLGPQDNGKFYDYAGLEVPW